MRTCLHSDGGQSPRESVLVADPELSHFGNHGGLTNREDYGYHRGQTDQFETGSSATCIDVLTEEGESDCNGD